VGAQCAVSAGNPPVYVTETPPVSPPVSLWPPSGSFRIPQTGAPESARARRLCSCTRVCVCPARRGCYPVTVSRESIGLGQGLESEHPSRRGADTAVGFTSGETSDLYLDRAARKSVLALHVEYAERGTEYGILVNQFNLNMVRDHVICRLTLARLARRRVKVDTVYSWQGPPLRYHGTYTST